MKLDHFINSGLGLCSLAAIALTFSQKQQVSQLRAQEQFLRESRDAGSSADRAIPKWTGQEHAADEAPLTVEETKELMRLRREVTQLKERKKELEAARIENDTLRARLASTPTNVPPSQVRLPSGYILRRNAQFQGHATPEASLQSFFWAVANHNTKSLMESIEGDTHRHIEEQFQKKGEEATWKELGILPGFVVTGTESRSDSEQELQLELMPGEKFKAVFRKVGAQWKLYDLGPATK